jgi:hypothetical protein
MSIQELEAEVKRLSPSKLAIFSKWFGKFAASSVEEAEHAGGGFSHRKDSPVACSESEPEYLRAQ